LGVKAGVLRAENSTPSRADFQDVWEPQPPGNLCSCKEPVKGILYFLIKLSYFRYIFIAQSA
jgi:hypothetical protein